MSSQDRQKRQAARLAPLFVDTEFVPTAMPFFTLYHPRLSHVPSVLPYSLDETFQQLQARLSGKKPPPASKGSFIKDYKVQARRKYIDGDELEIDADYQLVEPRARGAEEESKERCEICCLMLASMEVLRPLVRRRSEKDMRAEIIAEVNRRCKSQLAEEDVRFNALSFSTSTAPDNLTIISPHASPAESLSELIINSRRVTFLGIEIIAGRFPPSSASNQLVSFIDHSSGKQLRITDSAGACFRLEYEMVKQYKVQEVLEMLGIQNAERKGLKILDKIFQPGEIVYSLGYLYDGDAFLNFIDAAVATEREVFIQGIGSNPELASKELKQMAEEGRKSGGKGSVKQMSHLGLFCSECQIYSARETSFNLLYHITNRYIRNYFSHTSNFYDESISSRFAKGLYEQLMAKPDFKGKAYRRVGFELAHQKGDCLEFSGFIVATANPSVLDLASGPLYETRTTALTIISRTGKAAQKQSAFSNLSEIFFLPFSRFKVTERREDKSSISLTLQQSAVDARECIANVILWIDKPSNEAKNMFRAKLNILPTSIRLHRFDSTDKFVDWINANQKLLKFESTNIIVVTNMFRVENGKENPNAGAEAVLKGRQLLPSARYILYIGNKESTMATLRKNKIDPESLLITNESDQLEGYLVQQFNRALKRKQQEQLAKDRRIAKQNWQEFFPQIFEKEEKLASKEKVNVKQGDVQVVSVGIHVAGKRYERSPEPANIPIMQQKKIMLSENPPAKIPIILQSEKPFINPIASPKLSAKSTNMTDSCNPLSFVAALPPKKTQLQQQQKPKSTLYQPTQQIDISDSQAPANLKVTKSENQSNLYQFEKDLKSKLWPLTGAISPPKGKP